MIDRRLARCIAAAAAMWALSAGCSSSTGTFTGRGATSDIGATDAAPGAADVVDDAATAPPVIVDVEPGDGSFLGGTQVIVRGENFTADAVVHFGIAMAQPAYTMLLDSHRIQVVTPANNPGPVDVTVTEASGQSVLPSGYIYDAFYVDPFSGPLTGGARVNIHGSGTQFADGMTVTFDGLPCTMVQVTSPDLLDCVTPAHYSGSVPVVTTAGSETITVPNAYTYADNNDGTVGGLAGGPVDGSLTVLVSDANTGLPIPNAFVFLNDMPAAVPPSAGQTDSMGEVTLSPPGLMAPLTVTAAAVCYTTTTIESFNASAATVFLTPVMSPACSGSGTGPSQQPLLAATIQGQLVWNGSNETAPNPWDNIPQPRAGEERIAYVYASQSDIFQEPAATGFYETVLEVIPNPIDGPGYPFSFASRPAAVAVYAIAGIQNMTTMAFTPFVFGVARDVLASPGATVTGVLVPMTITLTHIMPVTLSSLPPQVQGYPNTLQGNIFLDLGGEGVIPFPTATTTGVAADEPYQFAGLPGLTGAIADGTFDVHFRYASGPINGPTPFGADMTTGLPDTPAPMSAQIVYGIPNPDDTLSITNWPGIPYLTVPTNGGELPDNRTVQFAILPALPDVLLLTLDWGTGTWQHFAPGTATSAVYPDLSTLMGLSDIPVGSSLTLSLVGLQIPGFNYNSFTYAGLDQTYWTGYSGQAVLVMH